MVADQSTASTTPRYPRHYRGPRATGDGKAEISRNGHDGENHEQNGSMKGGSQSPERPRRKRTPPQLFTDYKQVNESTKEVVDGSDASSVAMEDPYHGRVFWAKFSSHPFWPSVKCSEEDITHMEQVDGISVARASAKYGKQPCTAVIFLGSNNKAVVKSADMLEFSENFDKFTRKKKFTKSFSLGIEKADEIALRRLNEDAEPVCTGCKGDVPIDQIEVNPQPESDDVMICERCLIFVHAKCTLEAGKFTNPFGNDSPPSWFCADCVDEAPLTFKTRVEEEDRKRKKRRKSLPPAGGSKIGSKNAQTSDAASVRSVDQPSRKKSRTVSDSTQIEGGTQSPVDRLQDNRLRAGTPPLNVERWRTEKSAGFSKDKSDDFCFICGDGGTLVICDFENCSRSYHKYCLSGGDLASNGNDEDDDEEWICPWHCCAVCKTVEGHKPDSRNAGPGRKASVLAILPPINTLKQVEASFNKSVEKSASSSKHEPFIRCVNCPTALCRQHQFSTRFLFDGKASTLPVSVIRHAKKGYFKCSHCFGAIVNGAEHQVLPSVQFSKLLHRAWSRIVNGHEHLCKLFLGEITEKDLPKEACELWNTLKKKGVTNLFQVRDKIWNMKYSTIDDFSGDVELVSRLTATVYGSSSPIIAETAETLPLMLQHAVRSFSQGAEGVKKQKPRSVLDTMRAQSLFSKGTLYASVQAKGSLLAKTYPAKIASSSAELERLLTNTSFKSGQTLKNPGSKPARDEAHGVVASLLSAAQAVGNFDDDLPPSREALEEMLEEQSKMLRSAMRSTSVLRDAVRKTLQQYDIGNEGKDEDGVVTLGEMRLAAEYRMANRGLQQRCAKLKTLLGLEREGRIAAEEQVRKLKEALEQSK